MGAAILIPLLIAGGTTAIAMTAQRKQEKKAEKRAKQEKAEAMAKMQQQEGIAMQSGEYWDAINREQMELQSQENQMVLLMDIIKDKQKPPAQVYMLPPAKTYTPVQKINLALDQFFRRAG